MKRIVISVLFLLIASFSFGQNNGGLKKGFKGVFETTYQFGVGKYGLDRYKVNLTAGYQVNPYISFGAGTGLRYYFSTNSAYVPLLLDVKINFLDRKFSPYISLMAGKCFEAFNDFSEKGYLINLATGVCIAVYEKSAIFLGVEFESQQKSFYVDPLYYGFIYTEVHNSYSMSLNVGIVF
ncbi:MAG: hypothetical protein SO179_06620 [Bacteroidales bacterium]|jgi:hypothetical protein|nr:hypothetical protein [Bacteroidales bacterium]